MQCPHCSSTHFRVSRLRRGDLLRLLVLQYPVRCRDCRERAYGPLFFALALWRTHGPIRRRRHKGFGRA